jgi:hypothetical protein
VVVLEDPTKQVLKLLEAPADLEEAVQMDHRPKEMVVRCLLHQIKDL